MQLADDDDDDDDDDDECPIVCRAHFLSHLYTFLASHRTDSAGHMGGVTHGP